MDEGEILRRLERAFAEASMPLDFALTRDVTFEDVDGLDSIARVRVLLSVEEVFRVEISRRENVRMNTIGDLVDLLLSKQAD